MKIDFLGAGISGLATAWKLSDKHQVNVIEKTSKTGGMASSFAYEDFNLDYGPHKIYTQLPGILDEYKDLVKEDLIEIPKTNKLMIEGRLLDFPVKFTQLLTRLSPITSTKCVLGKVTGIFSSNKDRSYESYLRKNFGSGIYNTLFRDYAVKVWGDPNELSEEIAQRRIPVSSFFDLIRNILFGAKKGQSANSFHYPKYGIGMVCDKIVERIENNNGTIMLSSTVDSINISNNSVESLTLIDSENKKSIKETDFFVSTIPITILPTLLSPEPPQEVLDASKKIRYRSLVILYLILDKEKALDCNWIFFPGSDVCINRLSEQKSFSHHTCPEDKTALYAEITCDFEDEIWKSSDSEIYEKIMTDLSKVNLVDKADVSTYFTRRARHVYPVYDKEFRTNLGIILDYLDGIDNLQTTGRQGLFNYNNTDHSLDMANKTAEFINQEKTVEEWRNLRDYFDSYRIVD